MLCDEYAANFFISVGQNSITGAWKRSGMHPFNRNSEGWTQAINTLGIHTLEVQVEAPPVPDQASSNQRKLAIRQTVLDCYKEWVTKPLENMKTSVSVFKSKKPRSFIPVSSLGLDCSASDLMG